MSFEYHNSANIEFGVFHGALVEGDASIIPVDDDVKILLQDMVTETRAALGFERAAVALPLFEASEKYSAEDRLAIPLQDGIATKLKAFYDQTNIPTDAKALAAPQVISVYFCIIHDSEGNKLVALKRAAQFKAVLKRHLVRFIDDGLHAVHDTVFKLDSDFDILIADDTVYIKSAIAFESMAAIDSEVMAAAVQNTRELQRMVRDIDFLGLALYVSTHKRAARMIAALRSRGDLRETSITNLRRECRKAEIEVNVVDGKLRPTAGNEMGFLQMLDRRRYTLSLIAGRWEHYEAGSRKGVGVRERQQAAQTQTRGNTIRRKS